MSPPVAYVFLLFGIFEGICSTEVATVYFDQETYIVNETEGKVEPKLILSKPVPIDTTVYITAKDGSAKGNNIDFNLSTEVILEVNIPANQTSFTLNVGINDDDTVENNERFNLEIGAKLNYYVERGSPYNITITIVDNDVATVYFDQETYIVNETEGKVEPKLILSKPVPIDTTVYITAKDGSAKGNNIDYNLSTEAILEVNIPANQTSFTLNVGINDDDAVENNERFNLEIGAKLNYYVERGSPYNIIITIVDNDGFPQIDEGSKSPTIITLGNKRFTVGSQAYVFEGYSVTFNCNVVNGTPPITILWLRTNVKGNSSSMGNSSTITITDVKDGEIVSCNASNSRGSDVATSVIHVEGIPPYINESMTKPPTQGNKTFIIGSQAYVFEGYSVTFDCSVMNGPFPITVLWLRNNVEETSPSVGNSSNITITDAKDGENVSCNASNSIGFVVVTSIIHVVEDCKLICQNGGTLRGNCSGCECPPEFTGMECEAKIDVNVDFDQSSYRINEDAGFVELALVLSRSMNCSCYVALTVSATDITATRGKDYGPKTDSRVLFPDGTTRATFRIPIIDDEDYEDSETFQVTVNPLSLPYGIAIGSISRALVTIMDNDRATVRFKEADCSVYENIGSVEHTLVLNKPLSTDVEIEVITVDQTTLKKFDYEAGPYRVSITAGEIEGYFNTTIRDDDVYESDESFELVINHGRLPRGITRVQDYTSTVTILNDEKLINVSFNKSTFVYEHRGPIKPMLVLDKPSPCCLSVPIEVMSGTATGYDYDLGGNVSNVTINVTFPAGTTCAPFDIPIVDDILSEANETFTVSIMNSSLPFGIHLEGPDNAVLTIVDNDFYVSFGEASYLIYEDEGILEVVIELESNKKATTDIFVQVKDINNTAENGIDYDPGPFNVTIKKGEKNAILRVYIINDALYESGGDDTGEDFSLEIIRTSLKPVSGIHLGRTIKAKVTIVDDEYTLSFGENIYVFKENSNEAKLNFSVSRPFRYDTKVTFTYIDFTATGSHNTNDTKEIDYYANYSSDGLIFPAGINTINLTFKIVNDNSLESNELFRIVAMPPEVPSDQPLAAAEIIIRDDDDFKVTFEMDHYVIDKNQVDPTIKLLLKCPEVYNGSLMFPINLTVIAIDGNATRALDLADFRGKDYHFTFDYRLSFNDNESNKGIFFKVFDDNIVEPNETFFLIIEANSITTGLSPGRPNSRVIVGEYGRAMITIVNDDVSTLRIIGNNALSFSRPISENVTLNITYDGDKWREIEISAKKTQSNKYPLGISKSRINNIEVIVPNYFNRDSVVASKDFKNLITVNFSK